MSSILIASLIIGYFALLWGISKLTSKGADNETFFTGDRNSPWYVVAFGMIGASLSGVTFISVPGWVEGSQFSYMQMVLGYVPGYLIIAFVLLPLYYRLGLTSIYSYLGDRFGKKSYLTGASFFLLSRTLGAAARLYLVAIVLQRILFDDLGVPFALTVSVAIACIWVYTNGGGIKTIIWTDTLQTIFMLVSVVLTVYLIGRAMDWNIAELTQQIRSSEYSRVFFFDDPNSKQYFWKRFFAGMFIAIAMTGLDQDMMQKNLTCRNIKDAQKNMVSLSVVLVFVNLVFLSLGAVLYLYATQTGFAIPEAGDELFAAIATSGELPIIVGVLFLLGLIAAAYSSADSALTALTTSVCVDIIDIEKKHREKQEVIRKRVHILMSVLLFAVILIYRAFNDKSVIDLVFTIAGYTYGPLLGMFAFGILLKNRQIKDDWMPIIAICAPFLTFLLDQNSERWFNGFQFGFELLLVNSTITFLGMLLIGGNQSEKLPSN